MTEFKLYDILEFYYICLVKDRNIVPTKNGGDLNHIAWMTQQAHIFVEEGRVEKAMRWLGFIQGVLWIHRIFTLDELKNHSRPDGE